MRRQTEAGGPSAGSSRALRLDPSALPVSFTARDGNADARTRVVELDRERVVLRRAVAGISMTIKLPVNAFSGVSIRNVPADHEEPAAVAVMLEHRDPALSIPLFVSTDIGEIVTQWEMWARVLGQRLLTTEPDESAPPAIAMRRPAPRRRRSSPLKRRRPSILLRRRPGRSAPAPLIHRDEREIIARS